MADQLLIGRIGEGEDMLGSVQLRHEAGRILEQPRQPFALRHGVQAGQHAVGGFHHHRDHPARLAVFSDDGGIEQIHPAALQGAAAVEGQLMVFVFQCAAGHADRHHPGVEFRGFRPAFQHLAAQQAGMAVARETRIGLVVKHDAVRTPQQHQRHRRMQHQPDGGFQAGGPVFDRAQGGGPVMAADQRRHLATACEEKRRWLRRVLVTQLSPRCFF